MIRLGKFVSSRIFNRFKQIDEVLKQFKWYYKEGEIGWRNLLLLKKPTQCFNF
jgi:hypothetical protein